MANYNVTPNMNLPNPVPGQDPGPDYANNLQSSLNIVDQHNHSAGQGVLIQPNGINISSDLPFNGNNATVLKTVRFQSQASPIANSAPNIGCLYVAGNELWYNDYTGGNQVQITSNGIVNATASGISNGTASAVFSAGTLVVKSSSTSFANIEMQSAILSNSGNLTNQLTLQAPTLSSSYTLSLPAVPSVTSFMQMDNSGNMSASIPTSQGIQQGMLALRATGSTVGAGGVATSGSSGTFSNGTSSYVQITNFSVTITTTGRPVFIGFIGSGAGGTASVSATGGGLIQIRNNNTPIVAYGVNTAIYPCSVIGYVDFPSSGTYTYTGWALATSGLTEVFGCILVAYEL